MAESNRKRKKRWTIATVCMGLTVLVLVGVVYRDELQEQYLLLGYEFASEEDRRERIEGLRNVASARCVRPLLHHVMTNGGVTPRELYFLGFKIERAEFENELFRLLDEGENDEQHQSAYVLGKIGPLSQGSHANTMPVELEPEQLRAIWDKLFDRLVVCDDDVLAASIRKALLEFAPLDPAHVAELLLKSARGPSRDFLVSIPRSQGNLGKQLRRRVVAAYLANHLERHDLLSVLSYDVRSESSALEGPVVDLLDRDESSTTAKLVAISVLRKMSRTPSVAAALGRRLTLDSDPSVRMAALAVFRYMPDPGIVAIALKDQDVRVCMNALHMARRVPMTPAIINGLIPHLGDPRLSLAASQAIADLGPEVLEHIIEHSAKLNSTARTAVSLSLTTMIQLEKLGYQSPAVSRVIDRARQSLGNPNAQTRSIAAMIYAQLGRHVDPDELLNRALEGELSERVEILPFILDWKKAPRILGASSLSDHAELRLVALKGMDRLGSSPPLDGLQRVLAKFDDQSTLVAAAKAMTRVSRSEEPVPTLHSALERELDREKPRVGPVVAFLESLGKLKDDSDAKHHLMDRARNIFPDHRQVIENAAKIPWVEPRTRL